MMVDEGEHFADKEGSSLGSEGVDAMSAVAGERTVPGGNRPGLLPEFFPDIDNLLMGDPAWRLLRVGDRKVRLHDSRQRYEKS